MRIEREGSEYTSGLLCIRLKNLLFSVPLEATMGFQMRLQLVLAHEGFVAPSLCAWEGTVTCVFHQVTLPVDKVHEGSITAREDAWIWPASSMDSLRTTELYNTV